MAVINKHLPGYKIIPTILSAMVDMAKPGVKTIDINNCAEEIIQKFGVKSCNKGYLPKYEIKAFPTATCININNVIAHGIPSEEKLNFGDIVSFDLGIVDSFGNCADAAITVGVGKLTNQKKRLLYYAYQTMLEAVKNLIIGANTEMIAQKIQSFAALRGYKVNRTFAGHAIGRQMHEKPNIYNSIENEHQYASLEEGQIFCVEPMLTNGNDDVGIKDTTGWTVRTKDGKPSAFFEVMAKVTKDGPEILTNHIINPPSL